MPRTKVTPSRWYYVLAGVVLAAGLAGFSLLLFNGLSSLTGGLSQMVVPGQHELVLSETGGYTVFHEYQSVVGNKVYSMAQGGLPGLQCGLSPHFSPALAWPPVRYVGGRDAVGWA